MSPAFSSRLFNEPCIQLALLLQPPGQGCKLFSPTARPVSGLRGLWNTLQFSLAVRRPPLFNASLQNTKSVNSFLCRANGWSDGLPPSRYIGANVAAGRYWVITCWSVLLWMNPAMGIKINGLHCVKGPRSMWNHKIQYRRQLVEACYDTVEFRGAWQARFSFDW